MRESGIHRLTNTTLKKGNPHYIVMYYLVRDLRSAIDRYASGELLDVGCGNKPYEEFFTGKVSCYKGCDVVQSDLNKVDVICDATNLKFDSSVFDTVFSTQVIEHVSDPFTMLEEINRVLKKGGLLILSAPFSWELHEEPYDFFRYSKHGLRAMLDKAGFDIVELNPNGGKWAAVFQLNLNIIYSGFHRKGFLPRIVKGLFTKLGFTTITNKLGIWMDRKYYSDLLTLNYVVVARKR